MRGSVIQSRLGIPSWIPEKLPAVMPSAERSTGKPANPEGPGTHQRAPGSPHALTLHYRPSTQGLIRRDPPRQSSFAIHLRGLVQADMLQEMFVTSRVRWQGLSLQE